MVLLLNIKFNVIYVLKLLLTRTSILHLVPTKNTSRKPFKFKNVKFLILNGKQWKKRHVECL